VPPDAPADEGERRGKGRKSTRSDTVKRLPKAAVAVSTHSHLVLSLWTGTGGGSDHPHFEPLLLDAWRRVPNRRFKVVADAGYDSNPTTAWPATTWGSGV